MANPPRQPNPRNQVIQSVQSQVIYQGPLPEPETLRQYGIADPSFPERIMKMAEAHNAADVKLKERVSLSNLIVPVIGQIFTLGLGAGGILACIYLAKAGYEGGAIASIAASFAPMVINGIDILLYIMLRFITVFCCILA
jgi:uncharacterized membrane protein